MWGKDAGVEGAKKQLQKEVRKRALNGRIALELDSVIAEAKMAGLADAEINSTVDEALASADEKRLPLFHLVIDAICDGKKEAPKIATAIRRKQGVTRAVLRRMKQKGVVKSTGVRDKGYTWHLNLDHPMVLERLDG